MYAHRHEHHSTHPRFPPLHPTVPPAIPQTELAEMLQQSGFPQMNERELSVLCNLLRQQRVEETRERYGLPELGSTGGFVA